MPLDDAPGDGQREAKAAAQLVESRRGGGSRRLEAVLGRDEHESGTLRAGPLQPAVHDDHGLAGLFAEDAADEGAERGMQAYRVALDRGARAAAEAFHGGLAARFVACVGGSVAYHAEEVERLLDQGRGRIVELGNLVQLAEQRDQACGGLLGLLDHLPVPVVERRARVTLQHPEVSREHGRGRAELVYGER